MPGRKLNSDSTHCGIEPHTRIENEVDLEDARMTSDSCLARLIGMTGTFSNQIDFDRFGTSLPAPG